MTAKIQIYQYELLKGLVYWFTKCKYGAIKTRNNTNISMANLNGKILAKLPVAFAVTVPVVWLWLPRIGNSINRT